MKLGYIPVSYLMLYLGECLLLSGGMMGWTHYQRRNEEHFQFFRFSVGQWVWISMKSFLIVTVMVNIIFYVGEWIIKRGFGS